MLQILKSPFWFTSIFVSTKNYVKRDDFDFDIVIFPFLDGDIPRCPSYGDYISQLIRFNRVSIGPPCFPLYT